MVDQKTIRNDEKQRAIVEHLAHLQTTIETNAKYFNRLATQEPIKTEEVLDTPKKDSSISAIFKSFWSSAPAHNADDNAHKILTEPNIPDITFKDIYIWGSPGSGKTFLMDLFYESLNLKHKKRVHFDEFMLDIHQRIHALSQSDKAKHGRHSTADPVVVIAKEISKETSVLCLDEFQVLDIADAMILKRFFETLFNCNVVIVSTSNRPPDDLYLNGLQRFLFLPFIALLKEKCEVINLDGDIDYRRSKTMAYETYWYPLNPSTTTKIEEIFEKVSGSSHHSQGKINVMQGRTMMVRKQNKGVAMFTFAELCDTAVGSSDYIAIAQNFHTVIITDVPILQSNMRSVVRRFILLIDELYNKLVRVYISADASIQHLYVHHGENYDEIFAIERTKSRLMEMMSKEYLEKSSKINK